MTGGRRNKRKELASGSHRESSQPSTFRLIYDNSTLPSPLPPMAYLPLGSSTQSSDDLEVEMPVANLPSANVRDRIYILPHGNEFCSQTLCAHRIEKIIERKFNGPWESHKSVPIEVKDMWFNDFELEFSWCSENRSQIRKIFDTVSSNVLENKLLVAKMSNQKPDWISKLVWIALQEEWGMKKYKKMCETNKKNRASNCEGQGFPKYAGGSISYFTHMDRLTKKYGREPSVAELFMHTHSRLNHEGERVWIDERSRRTYEAYTEKYEIPKTDSGSSALRPPLATQIARWTEMVGGRKKGGVYGLGGLASLRL